MVTHEPYMFELSESQRRVLARGLDGWGGASHLTEEFALALGYVGVGEMLRTSQQLAELVTAGQPLRGPEWMVAIASAELFFGSGVRGGADDCDLTTGVSAVEGIAALVQIRTAWYRADRQQDPWWFRNGLGTRPLKAHGSGVFVPEASPQHLTDPLGRERLRSAVRVLALGPDGAVGFSDETLAAWFTAPVASLASLGLFAAPAQCIGTVAQRSEASSLARLAQLLRPWAEAAVANVTSLEKARRLDVWPLVSGTAAELHAWMLRNG